MLYLNKIYFVILSEFVQKSIKNALLLAVSWFVTT